MMSRADLDAASFPPDFVWGVATSAYQIEGSATADGKGPSIWDTFTAEPHRIRNGETGRTANDHYRRWSEDVDLLSDLGVNAYRFSISWPRVQPRGTGRANRAGLDFYSRLVDRLLDRGITPWVTLYHWDLPDELERGLGGWRSRETSHRFAEYAGLVADALGDRVSHFITLNEPWCSAFLGYGSALHAPGRSDPAGAVEAAHHLLLGHGLATEVLRERVAFPAVGITLNLVPVTTAEADGTAADAVRRLDGLHNRWFLDPILLGGYPSDVREDLAHVTDFGFARPEDADVIATPIDFLGVNYYTRHTVAPSPYPGSSAFEFRETGLPRTAMGWDVVPSGMQDILSRLVEGYPQVPIYITENGAAFDDEVADGVVHDAPRIDFLRRHLEALLEAREDGARVAGYFAWSLMDNFEWHEGYEKRFGLVHVDYDSQHRTVKDSGYWYADLIRRHRSWYDA